jgi:sulfide:quinone oxidoreductase
VFARAAGEAVAHGVAARILGAAPAGSAPARFDGKGGCYLETGKGEAAYVEGDFFAESAPSVILHAPARTALQGKEKFAKEWARWY